MFDQVMNRSNWVWIYKMGRFAEERRAFLSDMNEQGHSLRTLRNVNRFLLAIAERVNVRRSTEVAEVQIVRAARDWVAKSLSAAFQNRNARGRYQTSRRWFPRWSPHGCSGSKQGRRDAWPCSDAKDASIRGMRPGFFSAACNVALPNQRSIQGGNLFDGVRSTNRFILLRA